MHLNCIWFELVEFCMDLYLLEVTFVLSVTQMMRLSKISSSSTGNG